MVNLKKKKELQALTGGFGKDRDVNKSPLTDKEIEDLKKKRDSNIVWMSEPWIYKEIQPYIHTANKNAGWNFDWDFSESCQFTKYSKGQYYGWHCDSWDKPYTEKEPKNFIGKVRKLSCIVALSDPKEYEGGEVQFDFRNTPNGSNIITCEKIKDQGSIIIFPSFVWHQVKPITKGTRYSLVCWTLGKKFT